MGPNISGLGSRQLEVGDSGEDVVEFGKRIPIIMKLYDT